TPRLRDTAPRGGREQQTRQHRRSRHHDGPDLQGLVRKHGGYDKISPEAWAEHDRAMAEWQERRRAGSEGGPSSEIPNSDHSDPEALCICGLPGVYWRPRQVGGRAIWRCEEHRDRWPDYGDDGEAADDTWGCPWVSAESAAKALCSPT